MYRYIRSTSVNSSEDSFDMDVLHDENIPNFSFPVYEHAFQASVESVVPDIKFLHGPQISSQQPVYVQGQVKYKGDIFEFEYEISVDLEDDSVDQVAAGEADAEYLIDDLKEI